MFPRKLSSSIFDWVLPTSSSSPTLVAFVLITTFIFHSCFRPSSFILVVFIVRPRHGVYSPRSHSPSLYTYSLWSRSFGFYPFCRHSYSSCSSSPPHHDIRFRRSSSSSSSIRCLRFRQFACVDGFSSSASLDPTYDSSFASSVVVPPLGFGFRFIASLSALPSHSISARLKNLVIHRPVIHDTDKPFLLCFSAYTCTFVLSRILLIRRLIYRLRRLRSLRRYISISNTGYSP